MSDEAPWLPLAEAETRCMRAGVWPGSDLLSEILKSGRVPIRGKRSGYGRADPIESLLRRADHGRSYLGQVSVLWVSNEITLYLEASSPEHQRLAAELYERDHGRATVMREFLEWIITFTDVKVRWPNLVEELQAAGFKINTPRPKRPRTRDVPGRGADKGSPRPIISDDALRNSILLMEAVHDLRVLRKIDLRSAISEMIELLATGKLPPPGGLIDGVPTKIDARWWWVAAIEYPSSSAAFKLIIDGEERLTRAVEIRLDRTAWERERSRIAASAQLMAGSEPENPPALVTSAPGRVMPPDEAEGYTFLWDAAADMSRTNGDSPDRNWLRLMDAYWRGDLARDGRLMYFSPTHEGREFFVYERAALAGMLIGHGALDRGEKSVDELRNWRVADYQNQPADLARIFAPDPEGRWGLAVLTQELDRWRHRETGTAKPVAPRSDDKRDGGASRRRGPEPGTIDRYGAKDRALFPQLEALLADRLSVTAAALRLAEEDKIAGIGASGSRAKRLADRYRRERRSGA